MPYNFKIQLSVLRSLDLFVPFSPTSFCIEHQPRLAGIIYILKAVTAPTEHVNITRSTAV